MMNALLPPLLPLLASLLPMALVLAVLLLARHRERRQGRRSPLSDKLWNGPGQQLRRDLAKSDESLDTILLISVFSGPLLLATWALSRMDWSAFRFGIAEYVYVIAFVGVMLWAARKSVRLRAQRLRLREGLKAELMTAQLLMPLAGKGCQVFHDIAADNFNLDHVVIGPYAVFMVETKSRKKPGKGRQSAQVGYDGKTLHFPDHASAKAVEQARYQARWLADFLRQAAGEPTPVVPVVALPGWYVNYSRDAHKADVRVVNPKMHSVFMEKRGTVPLSESLRIRISYALTQRYPIPD
jgi:hypothetical protein